MVLGAITGYFNAAVGLLYVIAGTVGVMAASSGKRRVLSLVVCDLDFLCTDEDDIICETQQFFLLMVLTSVVGLVVNLVGLMEPTLITDTEERDFGFATIAPSMLWFIVALLFLAIFCIPCVTIASVNVCTRCIREGKKKESRKAGTKGKSFDKQPDYAEPQKPTNTKGTVSRRRAHTDKKQKQDDLGLDEYELSVLREFTEEAQQQTKKSNEEKPSPSQEQKQSQQQQQQGQTGKSQASASDAAAAAAAAEPDGVVIVEMNSATNTPAATRPKPLPVPPAAAPPPKPTTPSPSNNNAAVASHSKPQQQQQEEAKPKNK